MKIVLFVEGDTEKDVLPDLLKRCLEPNLQKPIGIQPVNFRGWANLWREAPKKAEFYLQGAGTSNDIIAVVSILDLYGPDIYPPSLAHASERYAWGKTHLEERVGHRRFRHYFAVHELEAWLFSQPRSFPKEAIRDVEKLSTRPEEINFHAPPKQRLNDIYEQRLKRGYQQRIDGAKLFRALLPPEAQTRCPYFSDMIRELITLSQGAESQSTAS